MIATFFRVYLYPFNSCFLFIHLDNMLKSDDHARYQADQLVSQRQVQHYNIPNNEVLYLIHETYSLGYRWEFFYSYENDSGNAYEKKIKTATETKVTSSNRDKVSANIKLELKA